MQTIEQRAIAFAAIKIGGASDWEEVGQALVNHGEFGPWLEKEWGEDYVTGATNIIRQAEERLGDSIPASYNN